MIKEKLLKVTSKIACKISPLVIASPKAGYTHLTSTIEFNDTSKQTCKQLSCSSSSH